MKFWLFFNRKQQVAHQSGSEKSDRDLGWKLRVLDGHTCVLSVFLAYGPNWGLVSGMEVEV